MKTKFNVKELEVLGVKLGGIEVEAEFSPKEILEMYQIQKKVIADLPMLTDMFASAIVNAFDNVVAIKEYVEGAEEEIQENPMRFSVPRVEMDEETCDGNCKECNEEHKDKETAVKEFLSRLTGIPVEKIQSMKDLDKNAQG